MIFARYHIKTGAVLVFRDDPGGGSFWPVTGMPSSGGLHEDVISFYCAVIVDRIRLQILVGLSGSLPARGGWIEM